MTPLRSKQAGQSKIQTAGTVWVALSKGKFLFVLSLPPGLLYFHLSKFNGGGQVFCMEVEVQFLLPMQRRLPLRSLGVDMYIHHHVLSCPYGWQELWTGCSSYSAHHGVCCCQQGQQSEEYMEGSC